MSCERERIMNLADRRLQCRRREIVAERVQETARSVGAARIRNLKVQRFRQLKSRLISESRTALPEMPEERLKRLSGLKGKMANEAQEIKQAHANIIRSQKLIAGLAREQLKIERQQERMDAIRRSYLDRAADLSDQGIQDENAALTLITRNLEYSERTTVASYTIDAQSVRGQEEIGRIHRGDTQTRNPLSIVESEIAAGEDRKEAVSSSEYRQNPERKADSTSVSFIYRDEAARETGVTVTLNQQGNVEVDLEEVGTTPGRSQARRRDRIRQALEQHGLGVAYVGFGPISDGGPV